MCQGTESNLIRSRFELEEMTGALTLMTLVPYTDRVDEIFHAYTEKATEQSRANCDTSFSLEGFQCQFLDTTALSFVRSTID